MRLLNRLIKSLILEVLKKDILKIKFYNKFILRNYCLLKFEKNNWWKLIILYLTAILYKTIK